MFHHFKTNTNDTVYKYSPNHTNHINIQKMVLPKLWSKVLLATSWDSCLNKSLKTFSLGNHTIQNGGVLSKTDVKGTNVPASGVN